MVDGAKAAAAMTIPQRAEWASAPHPRRPGRFWDCWPPVIRAATQSPKASSGFCRGNRSIPPDTVSGTKALGKGRHARRFTPVLDSRGCFISLTPTTAIISRCWRFRITNARWRKRRKAKRFRRNLFVFSGRMIPDGCSDFAGVDGCNVRPEAEAKGAQTLPARCHARAAVSLQSGVCRLRQDSVSAPHSEAGADAGRVLPRGRRDRRADGGHPRRRAAAAFADRQDCGRPGGAQEIRLHVHQRAAPEGKAPPLQAKQVLLVLGSPGWPARAPRLLCVP